MTNEQNAFPTNENTFYSGVKDCLPTLLGYVSIGFAFGVVGISSHLNLLEITLLSIFVYAGAAQFIFCALILVGTPMSIIILTTFIVNLRHLLMALAIAPSFSQYSLLKNIGFGSLLTDESFGVAMTKRMPYKTLGDHWMNGLNITAYVVWIAASIAGAVVGQWIPNPTSLGLDFALIAMFVALLVLTLSSLNKNQLIHYLLLIALMAVTIYVLLYFVSTHIAVLLGTLFVATIGVVTERK